jgi:flagellar hook-associated protein 1 FlgK
MGIYSINESASAALQIAQAGILVTSQNVAGTSVEGFSRRTANTVMNALAPNSLMLNGSSFAVEGFTRQYSSLLGAQLLNQQAKSTNSETLTQYVSMIDSVIADKSAGLSSAITDFFNTMGKYAAEPTNKALASAITASANVVAQRLSGISNIVERLKNDSSTGLNDAVRQINTHLPALGTINQKIIEANRPGNSAPSADLLDQRDRILTNLQKLIGGQSLINQDGTATHLVNGLPLVERGLANSISINSNGKSLAVNFQQPNSSSSYSQTIQKVDSGQMGALLTLSNEFIPLIEQRLNTTAISLVKVANEAVVDNSVSPIAIFGFKVGSNTFKNFNESNLTVAVPSFSLNSEIDVKNLYESLGSIAKNESTSVDFKPLSAGQTLTIAGLTFTAGSSGATAAQVSSAFANISETNTHSALNTSKSLSSTAGASYTGGTFTSGTVSGWNSGAATNNLATFTSSTSSLNVSNLTASGSSSASVSFRSMASGETLTIAGLTFTAGSSGATAAQVSSAFANISDTNTHSALNTSKNLSSTAGGSYTGGTFTSGPVSGWNSGAASNNSVTFLTSTVSQNVSNLTASGSLVSNLPTITMNLFPVITTSTEGYSGNSLFLVNKLTAANFISVAPTDPLLYYSNSNLQTPKISSENANTAQLKSSLFGNLVADLVTDVGVQVATWNNSKKADDAVLSNLKEQREQLSGVNLDEEAANLLKYQQLYSASTKILQTGNQMFNTLLAIMN